MRLESPEHLGKCFPDRLDDLWDRSEKVTPFPLAAYVLTLDSPRSSGGISAYSVLDKIM